MKITLRCLTAIMFLSLSSCMQSVYKAPYVLNGPESLVGNIERFFNYAGVFAQLHNISEKDIASLELSFDVFDRNIKENPFTGSNHIISSYNENIFSGETAELCISLDSYIHAVPEDPYIISNFCINTITYTDGSSWTDYLCIYSANSN